MESKDPNTAGVREWDYQYNPATLRLEAEALAFDTDDDGTTDFKPTVRRGFDAYGRATTLDLTEGTATHHSQTTRYWNSDRTMGIDVSRVKQATVSNIQVTSVRRFQ